MNPFENSLQEILQLLNTWEPRLLALSEEIIGDRKNTQNRSIRQILGHFVRFSIKQHTPDCAFAIPRESDVVPELRHQRQ